MCSGLPEAEKGTWKELGQIQSTQLTGHVSTLSPVQVESQICFQQSTLQNTRQGILPSDYLVPLKRRSDVRFGSQGVRTSWAKVGESEVAPGNDVLWALLNSQKPEKLFRRRVVRARQKEEFTISSLIASLCRVHYSVDKKLNGLHTLHSNKNTMREQTTSHGFCFRAIT